MYHVCLMILGLLVLVLLVLGMLVLVPATARDCPRAGNLVLLVVSAVVLPEALQAAWNPLGPPCKVRLGCWGMGSVIGLASALGRQYVPVHAATASAHPVRTCSVGVVLGAMLGACLAVVAIVDVATVGAAVPIVLANAVWVLLVVVVPSPK